MIFYLMYWVNIWLVIKYFMVNVYSFFIFLYNRIGSMEYLFKLNLFLYFVGYVW